MKLAVEHHFSGLTANLNGVYDSTKTMLSSLIKQYSGANYQNKYISPLEPAMIELMETFDAGGNHCIFDVVPWQNKFLIFVIQYQGTVAGQNNSKTIFLVEFDPNTSTFTYKGKIFLDVSTIPFAYLFGSTIGAKYFRSIRGYVYTHNTGTVSTSGSSTSIIGSGTQFVTERIASGARIGFGATLSSGITSWYTVNSITNDTSITIDSPVTLSAGTPYCIEEIRFALAFNNTTNFGIPTAFEAMAYSGIMLVKGINYDIFTTSGITLSGITNDNVRGFCILRSSIAGDFTKGVTVSFTSPSIFTCNNHGLQRTDQIWLTTDGVIPSGITSNGYITVLSASGNTFTAGSYLNSPLSATGPQSGTLYLHRASSASFYGLMDESNNGTTEHFVWATHQDNPLGGYSIHNRFVKFNLRANLNMRGISGTVGSTGSWQNDSSARILSSDAYITETRTINGSHPTGSLNPGYIDIGRLFARKTGSLAGITSWWWGQFDSSFVRIYRAPIENLTYMNSLVTETNVNFSPSWPISSTIISDAMAEIPPGGSNTYSGGYRANQIEYAAEIDRLLISPHSNTKRIAVVDYDTNRMKPYDKVIGNDFNRLYRTIGASASATGASISLSIPTESYIREKNGWLFTTVNSGTTGQHWIHAFPYAVDSEYHEISNQYVITPKLSTKDATKLYRVYVDNMEYAGQERFGSIVEGYRLWYRTLGIDDNSGKWIPVDVNGTLTDIQPTDYIQFKITFDIMGELCIPTKIYSIAVVYEDGSQDSHYEPSLNKSSSASKIFAWRQVSSWGGTIPNLRIRLFDNNNEKLLDDNVTNSTYGTWQYSTDGTTWNSWNSSADTVGNYIRYTVSSFGYGAITVRALLTQS